MTDRAATAGKPVYVADTHAFYWYLQNPNRLSPAADAIFRLAEAGGATIIVPAIVMAELYYVAKKMSHDISLRKLIDEIDETTGFYLSALDREQLERFETFDDITEMHDRLIAAEALAKQAIIVSKDKVIADCSLVTTVW